MRKIKDIKVVICVDVHGQGIILKYPLEFENHLDGSNCEDNLFENVPEKAGVYECDVEYWFSQGYSDGHPADGESDWEFRIVKSKLLVDFNSIKVNDVDEETCRYCTGRPLVDREPIMKSQLSDYNVFINSANHLEDSIIGGSAPHSLYGVKINYCPVCGKKLDKR
jgi:hypothetical protein